MTFARGLINIQRIIIYTKIVELTKVNLYAIIFLGNTFKYYYLYIVAGNGIPHYIGLELS